MSKIYKKETVRTLPETGEPDVEYFVPLNWSYPEGGGTTYVWRVDTWCPIAVSNQVNYYHDGIMPKADYKEFIENLSIESGTELVRCQADSLFADIYPQNPQDVIVPEHICFVQRKTPSTSENAVHIVASECKTGFIRIYFNKKSTSVFYVNYIVFKPKSNG